MVLAAAIATVALAGAAGAALWMLRPAPVPATAASLERLDDYGELPPFSLTERSGKPVTRDDLRGVVWVADFIYTHCTDTCPMQSRQFARLQRGFAEAPDFRLVSITVDPAHDTPEALRAYAARYGATDRWLFLTGARSEIYCLARNGFRLSAGAAGQPECRHALDLGPAAAWAHEDDEQALMHSARFVLVDRRGHVRAYHVSTDPRSIDALVGNARALLARR